MPRLFRVRADPDEAGGDASGSNRIFGALRPDEASRFVLRLLRSVLARGAALRISEIYLYRDEND
jgi:hypothetical protein